MSKQTKHFLPPQKISRKKAAVKAGRVEPLLLTAGHRPKPGSAAGAIKAENQRSVSGFPIAGIGASAGGLDALEKLFRAMPEDTGIGFVVVSHLPHDHTSMLPGLLARVTRLPVIEAADGVRVLPDHVYVAAPGAYLSILHGILHVMQAEESRTLHLPIDFFLSALAADQREKSVCIILSGTGTDGTVGLRQIRSSLGMTLVQTMESAKYAGMPASAASTGLADFVLPPEEMPRQLVAYSRRPFTTAVEEREGVEASKPELKIFLLVRERAGHDFSGYKIGTIRRRIAYRMNLHAIPDQGAYVRFLQSNPQEIDLLFRDFLIGVTGFFRDPEAFDSLARAIEGLIAKRPDNHIIRVWVPGCATGEEAYSLAIVLRETMNKLKHSAEAQVFATDLDSDAIDFARSGIYPEGIARDISPGRLDRYFIREGETYRVRREIRELVVFAVQNVISDPPFPRLDMICCRNLLIYFNRSLQKRFMPVLHYALNSDGLLFLGPSERVNGFSDLFESVDRLWKIYRRRDNARATHSLPGLYATAWRPGQGSRRADPAQVAKEGGIGRSVERLLLSRFAPASIVVDEHGEAIYFYGQAGAWFEPPAGRPRLNILDMARPGLHEDLSAALIQAAGQATEVSRERVRFKTDGDYSFVDLNVSPIADPKHLEGLFLVTLRPSPPLPGIRIGTSHHPGAAAAQTDGIELELKTARESLKATIKALAKSNDELRTANDELNAANEELWASKEERQSLNEELTTVNAQLQSKIEEFSRASDDLQNLLRAIQIGMIFLDTRLQITRYTEQARVLVNLIETDLGRPLADLTFNLNYEGLAADCEEVLRTLVCRQAEVQTKGGQWFLVRIAPYLTAEHKVGGMVLIFTETGSLSQMKKSVWRASKAFPGSPDPIVVVDLNNRIADVNEEVARSYGWTRDELLGQPVSMISPEAERDAFAKILERCRRGEAIRDVECPWIDHRGRESKSIATLVPLVDAHGSPEAVAIELRHRVE